MYLLSLAFCNECSLRNNAVSEHVLNLLIQSKFQPRISFLGSLTKEITSVICLYWRDCGGLYTWSGGEKCLIILIFTLAVYSILWQCNGRKI